MPPHPELSTIQSPELSRETDIVIIGSGITGCSVARALLEEEPLGPVHVTILEARTLTSGATGRNGVRNAFFFLFFPPFFSIFSLNCDMPDAKLIFVGSSCVTSGSQVCGLGKNSRSRKGQGNGSIQPHECK